MIEGENVKWSSMFKGIAGQLGKAGMERTESSLAKLLGFGGKSKTKNLGTSSNPMYVKVMSLPGGGPGGSGGSTGNQGGMGGLLGAIAGNGKSHSTGCMGFLRNMLGTNGAIQSLNLGPGTIDPLGAAPNVDVSGMAGDPMAGLNSIFSHAANGGDVTAGASLTLVRWDVRPSCPPQTARSFRTTSSAETKPTTPSTHAEVTLLKLSGASSGA